MELSYRHDITGMISETAYIYWKFREAAQQYDRAEADVRSREEHFKGFPLMQERYQSKIKTAAHDLQEAKKEWNLRQDNLERGMKNAVKLETERLIEGNLRKVEKYVREVLETHMNSAASRTSVAPAEVEFLKREIHALKQRPIMPVIPSSELKELRRELDQLKQKDEQREKQMQELTKQAEVRYGEFEVQAKIAQTTQNQIREGLDAVKSALQELKKDIPGMQKQIGLNTETINEHKKLQSRVEKVCTFFRLFSFLYHLLIPPSSKPTTAKPPKPLPP
jgi:chromosome segregation ATPase